MPVDLNAQLEVLGEILLDLAPPLSTDEIKREPVRHDLEFIDAPVTAIHDLVRPNRRPRWLVAAAALLLVGTVSALVIVRHTGDVTPTQPSLVPTPTNAVPTFTTAIDGPTTTHTATSTEATSTTEIAEPATTADPFVTTTSVATTTTQPIPDLDFTPLALSAPPAGYTFDRARYSDTGDVVDGWVRYVGPPGAPELVVLIRPIPNFLDWYFEQGRQTWDVNGRTFINDNQDDACAPDVCSIGVQWDDGTEASIMWAGDSATALGPQHTMESLVALAALLGPADPALFELGPVVGDAYAYDIEKPGLLPSLAVAGTQAGNMGAMLDSGQGAEYWSNVPSRIALATSDGRLIIEPLDGSSPQVLLGPPGEVRIPGPGLAPVPVWPAPVPLWPDAAPFSHRLQDTALLDDRIWLLYTETTPAGCTSSPCTMSVDLAPLDDLTDVRVMDTLSDAAEIGANTRLTLGSSGFIGGVIERPTPVPFRLAFDPQNIRGGALTGTRPDPSPTLYAVDDAGVSTAEILEGTLSVNGRTVSFPAGFSAENTVGLDIAVTNDAATQGAIVLSGADGRIAVIDLADGSVTVLRERTGLATFG